MDEPIDIPDNLFKQLVMKLLIEIKADQVTMLSYIERLARADNPLTPAEVEWLSRMTKEMVSNSYGSVLYKHLGQIPDELLPDGISGSED